MKKLLLFAIVILGFSAVSFGQTSIGVKDDATASATIVSPIAIAKSVDMDFGNVAVSGTGGTVILSPAGGRSFTGGVTLPANDGDVAAAEFTVTGAEGFGYDITLPTSDLTISTGSNNMTVKTFTSTPEGDGTLTGGTSTIKVGATLVVANGQAEGTYTGTFEVTVNYN